MIPNCRFCFFGISFKTHVSPSIKWINNLFSPACTCTEKVSYSPLDLSLTLFLWSKQKLRCYDPPIILSSCTLTVICNMCIRWCVMCCQPARQVQFLERTVFEPAHASQLAYVWLGQVLLYFHPFHYCASVSQKI